MKTQIEKKLNENIGYNSPRFTVSETSKGFEAHIQNRGYSIMLIAEQVANEFGFKMRFDEEKSDSFSDTFIFFK